MPSALWRSGLRTCRACNMLIARLNSLEIARILRSFKSSRMHLPVFFCIQLTFIISNDCCTTVILPSVLTIILVPDLVLFKFRHLPNFWYFKNFFWLAILVGGGRWGNENMNCVGTWISRLKLVKNILRWSLVFWDICPMSKNLGLPFLWNTLYTFIYL